MQYGKISLKYKFLLTFIFFIVLPIVLVMGIVLQRHYNVILETKLNESRNLSISYGKALEEDITRLSLKLSALAYNHQFLDAMKNYNNAEQPFFLYQNSREITNILDIFFDYSSETISVFIFLDNREPFVYKNPPLHSFKDIKKDFWYSKIENKPEQIFFIDDLTYQRTFGTPLYRLTSAIRPSGNFNSGIEGIIVMVRSRVMKDILRVVDEQNRYVLFNKDGQVLFSAGFPDDQEEFGEPEKGILKYEVEIEKTGWSLVHYVDMKQIRRQIFNSMILFLVLMFCITVMFIIYIFSLMKQIFGPIEESIKMMPLIEKGDFSIRLEYSEVPELNKMTKSFNKMISEIELLTKEIRRKEQEKRSIEIQALQFQINPHFLSNTLNTIKIMARLIDAESIRETTTCLMRIVSNSFREPGELNTLDREIVNLNDYIHIMKIRFGDTFRVIIREDENLKEVKIMKMLIQPLVENAIVHGLIPKEREGCLFIHFRNIFDKLVIDIVDNGIGIKDIYKLDCKNLVHKGLYRIGITNVRDRIKMNYGDKYGLSFSSRLGFYTKVTLTVPSKGILCD